MMGRTAPLDLSAFFVLTFFNVVPHQVMKTLVINVAQERAKPPTETLFTFPLALENDIIVHFSSLISGKSLCEFQDKIKLFKLNLLLFAHYPNVLARR